MQVQDKCRSYIGFVLVYFGGQSTYVAEIECICFHSVSSKLPDKCATSKNSLAVKKVLKVLWYTVQKVCILNNPILPNTYCYQVFIKICRLEKDIACRRKGFRKKKFTGTSKKLKVLSRSCHKKTYWQNILKAFSYVSEKSQIPNRNHSFSKFTRSVPYIQMVREKELIKMCARGRRTRWIQNWTYWIFDKNESIDLQKSIFTIIQAFQTLIQALEILSVGHFWNFTILPIPFCASQRKYRPGSASCKVV